MVSFNDYGTEAEALAERDPGEYSGRGRTKYTTCIYCKKSFPLREISRHARTAHYEESTKYTNCRKCGGRFPLREIRMHARGCGELIPRFEPVVHNAARDEITLRVSLPSVDVAAIVREKLVAAEDERFEEAVAQVLRERGWTVERDA